MADDFNKERQKFIQNLRTLNSEIEAAIQSLAKTKTIGKKIERVESDVDTFSKTMKDTGASVEKTVKSLEKNTIQTSSLINRMASSVAMTGRNFAVAAGHTAKQIGMDVGSKAGQAVSEVGAPVSQEIGQFGHNVVKGAAYSLGGPVLAPLLQGLGQKGFQGLKYLKSINDRRKQSGGGSSYDFDTDLDPMIESKINDKLSKKSAKTIPRFAEGTESPGREKDISKSGLAFIHQGEKVLSKDTQKKDDLSRNNKTVSRNLEITTIYKKTGSFLNQTKVSNLVTLTKEPGKRTTIDKERTRFTEKTKSIGIARFLPMLPTSGIEPGSGSAPASAIPGGGLHKPTGGKISKAAAGYAGYEAGSMIGGIAGKASASLGLEYFFKTAFPILGVGGLPILKIIGGLMGGAVGSSKGTKGLFNTLMEFGPRAALSKTLFRGVSRRYIGELPSVKKMGVFGAMNQTLGQLYAHLRLGQDEANRAAYEQVRILSIAHGVPTKVVNVRTRRFIELWERTLQKLPSVAGWIMRQVGILPSKKNKKQPPTTLHDVLLKLEEQNKILLNGGMGGSGTSAGAGLQETKEIKTPGIWKNIKKTVGSSLKGAKMGGMAGALASLSIIGLLGLPPGSQFPLLAGLAYTGQLSGSGALIGMFSKMLGPGNELLKSFKNNSIVKLLGKFSGKLLKRGGQPVWELTKYLGKGAKTLFNKFLPEGNPLGDYLRNDLLDMKKSKVVGAAKTVGRGVKDWWNKPGSNNGPMAFFKNKWGEIKDSFDDVKTVLGPVKGWVGIKEFIESQKEIQQEKDKRKRATDSTDYELAMTDYDGKLLKRAVKGLGPEIFQKLYESNTYLQTSFDDLTKSTERLAATQEKILESKNLGDIDPKKLQAQLRLLRSQGRRNREIIENIFDELEWEGDEDSLLPKDKQIGINKKLRNAIDKNPEVKPTKAGSKRTIPNIAGMASGGQVRATTPEKGGRLAVLHPNEIVSPQTILDKQISLMSSQLDATLDQTAYMKKHMGYYAEKTYKETKSTGKLLGKIHKNLIWQWLTSPLHMLGAFLPNILLALAPIAGIGFLLSKLTGIELPTAVKSAAFGLNAAGGLTGALKGGLKTTGKAISSGAKAAIHPIKTFGVLKAGGMKGLMGRYGKAAFGRGGLNLLRKGTKGMIAKAGAKSLGKKALSRIPGLGGLITAGFSLAEGDNVGTAASKGVGSMAGAAAGAVIGQTLLPFLPGLGAVIGAVAGGWVGEKAGGWFAKTIAPASLKVVKFIGDIAKSAYDLNKAVSDKMREWLFGDRKIIDITKTPEAKRARARNDEFILAARDRKYSPEQKRKMILNEWEKKSSSLRTRTMQRLRKEGANLPPKEKKNAWNRGMISLEAALQQQKNTFLEETAYRTFGNKTNPYDYLTVANSKVTGDLLKTSAMIDGINKTNDQLKNNSNVLKNGLLMIAPNTTNSANSNVSTTTVDNSITLDTSLDRESTRLRHENRG